MIRRFATSSGTLSRSASVRTASGSGCLATIHRAGRRGATGISRGVVVLTLAILRRSRLASSCFRAVEKNSASFAYVDWSVHRHLVSSLHWYRSVAVAAGLSTQGIQCLYAPGSDAVVFAKQSSRDSAGLPRTLSFRSLEVLVDFLSFLVDILARSRLFALDFGETRFVGLKRGA